MFSYVMQWGDIVCMRTKFRRVHSTLYRVVIVHEIVDELLSRVLKHANDECIKPEGVALPNTMHQVSDGSS